MWITEARIKIMQTFPFYPGLRNDGRLPFIYNTNLSDIHQTKYTGWWFGSWKIYYLNSIQIKQSAHSKMLFL